MSVLRDFPDLPPVWAAGALVLQFAATASLPLARFDLAGIGWAVLGVGIALIGWSAYWFWRKRTSIEPRDTPSALIVEGPFRLNRNPIYSGMAICLLGTGVILGSLAALLLVPTFLWIVTRRFVLGEEAALRAAFGPEAEAYIARTRRW
ncbi:MAG: isoprenylcysteine carboxylmethyltransferase family protein [Pseudomonadota bacterium]